MNENRYDDFLYDSVKLLSNLQWDNCPDDLFHPKISPTDPGENLIMRSLSIHDYEKGFPSVLNKLTVVGTVSREQFVDTFKLMKSCPNMYYVTVIEDTMTNRIVGAATLFVEQKFVHTCAKRGRVEDVVVDDSHRGRQLGKLLVETSKRIGIAVGCYKVSLDCRDQLVPFYSQMDFKIERGNSNFMVVRLRD